MKIWKQELIVWKGISRKVCFSKYRIICTFSDKFENCNFWVFDNFCALLLDDSYFFDFGIVEYNYFFFKFKVKDFQNGRESDEYCQDLLYS